MDLTLQLRNQKWCFGGFFPVLFSWKKSLGQYTLVYYTKILFPAMVTEVLSKIDWLGVDPRLINCDHKPLLKLRHAVKSGPKPSDKWSPNWKLVGVQLAGNHQLIYGTCVQYVNSSWYRLGSEKSISGQFLFLYSKRRYQTSGPVGKLSFKVPRLSNHRLLSKVRVKLLEKKNDRMEKEPGFLEGNPWEMSSEKKHGNFTITSIDISYGPTFPTPPTEDIHGKFRLEHLGLNQTQLLRREDSWKWKIWHISLICCKKVHLGLGCWFLLSLQLFPRDPITLWEW